MSPFKLFEAFWQVVSRLTEVDRSPLIDPLYWHGRAPTVGYWALGITVAITWFGALCWIVYVIRASRRDRGCQTKS